MYKDAPKQAWKIGFGDVPWNRATNILAPSVKNRERTIVGIPLGGFGTASCMYNYTGTFGPWQLKTARLNRRFLDSAAFHVYEKVNAKKVSPGDKSQVWSDSDKIAEEGGTTVRTLAAEEKIAGTGNTLKPAWKEGLLDVGSAEYYGLYPRGWVDYKKNFVTNLKMEFFSPIIANNYRETSFPQAGFIFSAHNPSDREIDLSIMFTFPNMDLMVDQMYLGKDIAANTQEAQANTTISRAIPRKGLKNNICKEDNITGILMRSDSEDNTLEVQGSEFCIAAKAEADMQISCADWDASSDGSEIFKDFAEDGAVSGNTDSATPAGALAVRCHLNPGETKEIVFSLSWHIPIAQVGDRDEENTQYWWKKYTEFYPAGTTKQIQSQAFNIARDALTDMEKNLDAVEEWQNVYLGNPAFEGKEWVLTCGLNEMYYNVFGGSFWETGFIGGKVRHRNGSVETYEKPPFGNRDYTTNPLYKGGVNYQQKHQCVHYTVEAQDFPMAETFDVRAHSHSVYTDLWPEIERDILLLYKDFVMDSGNYSCPHDAGSPYGGALFEYDRYMTLIAPVNPEYGILSKIRKTTPWSEYSPKFILYSYQYWQKTKDDAFLEDIWEAVVQTYIYQRKTDTDNDGVTNMKSSEYNDNELFNSVLWIASLEAIKSWCDLKDKNPVVDYEITTDTGELVVHVSRPLRTDVENEIIRARKFVEEKIWNSEGKYYRFNRSLNVIMADAFIGERQAQLSNLPPTLDEKRMAEHFKMMYRNNVEKSGIGQYKGMLGAANLFNMTSENMESTADGALAHGSDAWTGVSYVAAATMYELGEKLDDAELKEYALKTAYGVYHTTYVNEETAYFFGTPEAWNLNNPLMSRNWMYQRARGAWELLRSVAEDQV